MPEDNIPHVIECSQDDDTVRTSNIASPSPPTYADVVTTPQTPITIHQIPPENAEQPKEPRRSPQRKPQDRRRRTHKRHRQKDTRQRQQRDAGNYNNNKRRSLHIQRTRKRKQHLEFVNAVQETFIHHALHGYAVNPDTGRIAQYPELSQCSEGALWEESNMDEWGRLMNGHQNMKTGTNTLKFICLLYTSPSPRDATLSRMPSSA